MSTNTTDDKKKVTTSRIIDMKARGEKIAMLTAYDYTMAKLIDEAGIDMILVGDSASNVMVGNATTLPMTLDQMIYHAQCVSNGVNRALVVCDMPFGSYQGDSIEALHSAVRIMKESRAEAVKIEGGEEVRESIERILSAGIPGLGAEHVHVRYLRRARQAGSRGTEADSGRPDAPGDRLLRPRAREDTRRARQACERGADHPHHRHRRRRRLRRPVARASTRASLPSSCAATPTSARLSTMPWATTSTT